VADGDHVRGAAPGLDILAPAVLTFSRRAFLKAAVLVAGGSRTARLAEPAPGRETLYNGITLATPWPPRNRFLSTNPETPPYLRDPPAVIPIDVGRQLFVDDFLVEECSLSRTYHRAAYHPAGPVLRPEAAWERRDEAADRTQTRPNPTAMVFSDGVVYDARDRLFKMWYMGGYSQNTCFAVSDDGLAWRRPELDVVRGTNIVMERLRDSNTVWLDHVERDPQARFKMAAFNGSHKSLLLFTSPDGIHWIRVGESGPCGDRSTMFYNPFRGVWAFSLRGEQLAGFNRYRRYWETKDFRRGAAWRDGGPVPWMAADALDLPRPDYGVAPELYNLDAVGYESLILGLFTIFRGERPEREKPNDVGLGFSRDGFHWSRPNREPFIPVSERAGDWNWSNVQSAGGCCLVVGDRLYFYVSGRSGRPGTSDPGVCSTGLALLRRDGFASLHDEPDQRPVRYGGGVRQVTTRPVRFSGRHLFVNADVTHGALQVEVLDRAGRVLPPFSLTNANAVAGVDGTRLPIRWATRPTLDELIGEPVRFRFSLKNGRLYSFWVSPSPSGVSRGYVAAGGPDFPDATDR
jgi:hypothetical protein